MKHILFFLIISCCACGKIPAVEEEHVLVLVPYPNPTSDRLDIYIENGRQSAYLIQVFDPKADLIFEENVEAGNPKNSFSIDLTGRSKGSYQVILKMNSVVHNKKVIKI